MIIMMINQTYSNLNLSHKHTKKKRTKIILCVITNFGLFPLKFILFALSHDFCLFHIFSEHKRKS